MLAFRLQGWEETKLRNMELLKFFVCIAGAEWTVDKIGLLLQISPHDAAAAIFESWL